MDAKRETEAKKKKKNCMGAEKSVGKVVCGGTMPPLRGNVSAKAYLHKQIVALQKVNITLAAAAMSELSRLYNRGLNFIKVH